MSKQLFVVVRGSGIEEQLIRVNVLQAGLEKRDSVEAGWRVVGWHRDGFNPARFVRFEEGREEEWRIAVVAQDGEWREETVEE